MEHSPQRTLLVTSACLAALAVLFYMYMRPTPAAAPTIHNATSSVGSLPAGATLTEVSLPQAPKAPDYHTPVAYAEGVTAEVKAAIEPRVAADVALLAKNNQDFDAWMNLAILHKIGGDYRGAEAVWLYATKEWPTSSIAFHNLGDLYENFLHDTTKAQLYYAQAAKLQ